MTPTVEELARRAIQVATKGNLADWPHWTEEYAERAIALAVRAVLKRAVYISPGFTEEEILAAAMKDLEGK